MTEELDIGIQHYRAGRKEEARRIFLEVIKEQPGNIRAYQWLYNVAHNDNERVNILKKIMELDPNQQKAKELYAGLMAKGDLQTTPPPPPKQVIVQPPPARKNNNLLIGTSLAIVIVICCICGAIWLNGSDTATLPSITGYKIKYVLSGSARSAVVTYDNETGGTEQRDVKIPWTKEMTVEAGAYLGIVAQNDGAGTITCEIWVNGEKRKTSTSTTQYGVVTCSDFAY